jgi:hypothetical protein
MEVQKLMSQILYIPNFRASRGVLPGKDIWRVWRLAAGLIERLSWSKPWSVTRPRDLRVITSFFLSSRIASTIDSMIASTLAITQSLSLLVIYFQRPSKKCFTRTHLVLGTRCSNRVG